MSQMSEDTWQSGIMKRWPCDQKGQVRRSDYGCQAVVRYRGTDDQGRLTVYTHRISGAEERERIRQQVEKLQSIQSHPHQEWLADCSIEMVDQPFFPLCLGPGLHTVSMPAGTHSLRDYYDWHNRLMIWKELIAFCHCIMPAVTALHKEKIYHGNITAENISFAAGSSNLQHVAMEECSLFLGSPYPFCQTLACFPHTLSSFLMRTPEQINQRFGEPGPSVDIRQLATMLYHRLTGFWPLNLSSTPSLQQIIDAICDEKKVYLGLLPEPLRSAFARVLGECHAGPRLETVEEFSSQVVDAAQELQAAEERAQRRRQTVRGGISRRQVVRRALAAVTAGSLIVGVTVGVQALEYGARPAPLPASPVGLFNVLGNQLTAIVSLPGKEFIVGDMTGLLNLYVLGRHKPLVPFQVSNASVRAIALSADGQVLVCCDEHGLVSQLGVNATKKEKQGRLSHDVRALALLGTDILISEGARVSIFSRALETPWSSDMSAPRQYQQHSAAVTGLVAVSDGVVGSSSMDGTVKMWHTGSGETICTYEQHTSAVFAVAATAGSEGVMLASGDSGGTVDIWVPQGQGKRIARYQHRGAVHALAWSPSGRYLLSGGDDSLVQVYDTQKMQIIEHFTFQHEPVRAVTWLSDRLMVTMSAGGLCVWQTRW
jgi:hypothetical protein